MEQFSVPASAALCPTSPVGHSRSIAVDLGPEASCQILRTDALTSDFRLVGARSAFVGSMGICTSSYGHEGAGQRRFSEGGG